MVWWISVTPLPRSIIAFGSFIIHCLTLSPLLVPRSSPEADQNSIPGFFRIDFFAIFEVVAKVLQVGEEGERVRGSNQHEQKKGSHNTPLSNSENKFAASEVSPSPPDPKTSKSRSKSWAL